MTALTGTEFKVTKITWHLEFGICLNPSHDQSYRQSDYHPFSLKIKTNCTLACFFI